MNESTGMLDLESLRSLVSTGAISTVITAFPDLYGRLMGKRFDANFFLESVAQEGTHGCDYLLTVDMEMEPVAGYSFANWEQGYGDFHLVPDVTTLRHARWLDETAIVICDLQNDKDHKEVDVAPRSMLRKQIRKAAEHGLIAKAGSELEYYIFRDSYQKANRKQFQQLRANGQYLEDYHLLQGTRSEPLNAAARRALQESGIPVECTKGEWGLGQHELNLRYTDVLGMADRHTLYKQCLKEIADSLNTSVTFMAKYAAEQAGSSCHIHLSLWRQDTNAFAGNQTLGEVSCSDLFRWFLGGWIRHARELMVFFAPTINSYKRFQSGSWAPTRLAWSYDNRTAGFRVVGRGQSLRVECRIPGADCNPYLAYAAAMAAGLRGIENQIEPPDCLSGNVYNAENVPHVPKTLNEAIDALANSTLARAALGDEVVEHYLHFYRTEQAAFDQAVTDWERIRYFERI